MTDQATRTSDEDAQMHTATGLATVGTLATKDLKRLYNLSRAIRALSLFWLLAASFAILVIASPRSELSATGTAIYSVFALIAAVAAFAGWRFLASGRVLGLAVSAVLLAAFPIGTLFGVLGLVAFWRGKPLFGAGRLTRESLKAELAQRRMRDAA